MFNSIAQRLAKTIRNISNKGRITEENIEDTLREIRKSFLEADVSFPVIKKFIKSSKKKIIGKNINNNLTPGQEFLKIIKNELINFMEDKNNILDFSKKKLNIFLFVGQQGVGKTTTIGKIGKFIKKQKKKKILITSTDVYRAAAIKQLEILSLQIKIDFFPSNNTQKPIEIAKSAISYAKRKNYDLILIDTAGRLHIDEYMISEIKEMHQTINPNETLFVVDSMMGQDSINVAKKFNETIPLSGIILTKTDSDARGGAALSVKYIVGKAIKFIGTGEKLNDIELFNPKKMACKILGMETTLSIIKDIEKKINLSKSKNLKKTIQSKKKFDLNHFLIQIKEMKNFDGIFNLINKISRKNILNNKMNTNFDKKTFKKIESIISSMTEKEKRNPEIIKGSRKKRISKGSGTKTYEVNRVLKQFEEVKKMMKKIKNKSFSQIINNIKNMI
ncbi:Signal recognition particle protein [Buchnera aphidicola (Tetraneura ulmi)]|uniref:signal recognition particle protein n=1 Tax=Buchnera aphidicola TaxID=9 RepID=UPI0034643558